MRKERTALTLVILLPLIVLFGYFKAQLLTSKQDEEFAKTRFWMLKARRTDTFDVILLGDSRVTQGLSPAAMQTMLNDLNIFNLGFASGGLDSEIYALAEQRLSPTSAQPIIVIGITPYDLTPVAAGNTQYHGYQGKSAFERFFTLHLTPYLVIFSPIPLETLLEYLQFFPPTNNQVLIQEYYDDGWLASQYSKDDHSSALAAYNIIFENNLVSEELVQELITQTKQWTQAGILVFGFRFPSTEGIEIIEDESSDFDEAALKVKFVNAGGIWLDFPSDAYRSYDGSHLHKAGALEFSVDLAEIIKAYLTDSDE
ncbi:MAG: hypothetical protein JXB38_09025 [Anaerolineales bacterium]|nr:hypothetical protein [Anaerolineales bacterium]